MNTAEPMGRRIERLLRRGMPSRDIVETLGCSLRYVNEIKAAGSVDRMNAVKLERARRRGVKTREQRQAERARECAAKWGAVIAAVDAGMTYSEAARAFGLKSRNCVAGILSRRPESRL